jgi:Flp pilus assembly secretin CpaC
VVLLKSHVVQVDVKVVEINKNRMQQAGINLFSTRSNSQGFRFGVLSAGATGSTAFGSPACWRRMPARLLPRPLACCWISARLAWA